MESSGGATTRNWTEEVEDLVHGGEVDRAISFLESTVSNLESELEKELQDKNGGGSSSSIADQLATALEDLSKLYSAEGFSLRADQTFSRALQIKHGRGPKGAAKPRTYEDMRILRDYALLSDTGECSSFCFGLFLEIFLLTILEFYFSVGWHLRNLLNRIQECVYRGLRMEKESMSNEFSEARDARNEAISDDIAEHGYDESSSNLHNDGFPQESCAEDDWEAIADRAPEELLSPNCLPGVSKLSLEDSKEDSNAQGTKRRGRGTFSYKKQGLYSDNQSEEPDTDDSENTSVHQAEDLEKRNSLYGTRHVLVLSDFPPSTRTTDLEKVLEKFKDRFVIRWVNDTTSLAVFRTPSVALEAINSVQCPFTVRVLDESEELLSKIPPKDLEPPRQRPQTSARTAQRLIAQGMGIRLPSTFGSSELRKQEEARRNRIVSRQNMRDDAWGDDPN